MSVGGYDVECVDEISKDFYCIICLKLMRNAIQMNCGHGMCRTCFDEMIVSYQRRNVALECPLCRIPTFVGQIVKFPRKEVLPKDVDVNIQVVLSPMIDRVISSLKVMCQAHADGCEWIGELSNMQTHGNVCEFRNVVCPIPRCNTVVQYCKVTEHIRETCGYFEHDCLFKDFGCIKKVNIDTKHIHEGDANHLMLFQQLLKEKDVEIEKLKKENEILKDKLVSFEDMKLKMDDMYALMKSKPNSIALNAESAERFSPSELNHSNVIIDEIKNKCDLVEDLNDEKSIHESILKHRFFKNNMHDDLDFRDRIGLVDSWYSLYLLLTLQFYSYERPTKTNLFLSLLKYLKKQVKFLEKHSDEYVFNDHIMSSLCDSNAFEIELQHNFMKYWETVRSVSNLKNYIMETFNRQIRYLRMNDSVWSDKLEEKVLITGKYCYVRLGKHDATFEVEEGLQNYLRFYDRSVEIHVYSIEEVMICNRHNCIELEPTNLLSKTFDCEKKRNKRIFTTKRTFAQRETSSVIHDVVFLRLLLEP